MKKIKRLIKLTNLNPEHLEESQLSHVFGGACSCSCFYCSCGGSSKKDNKGANAEHGWVSPLPPDDVDCGICT
jgi:natural product precursor